MSHQSGADVFRPVLKQDALLYDIVLIFGATIFIALSAQISLQLVFSPVPITGQTFAVLVTAALLGSKRGVMAILLYLLQGISGMPVFAGAGFGLTKLAGPTGGYLIGFLPAAYITGYLAEQGWDRQLYKSLLMMMSGTLIIFVCGLFWLEHFTGPDHVASMGLFPFIPGALIKIVMASCLVTFGMNYLRNRKNIHSKPTYIKE